LPRRWLIAAVLATLMPASLAVAQSPPAPAAADPSLGPIIAEGLIAAPIDAVWAAWTTADGLRRWLAPHVEFDLRVGGRMRTNYRAEGTLGDAGTIENTVLAYDPQRMLAIKVTRFPQGFPFPTAVQSMWTVIYLEPAAYSGTVVRIVGLGFTSDEESQRMRAFFERGNRATLQQLQQRFAAAAPGEPSG